ncbi:hypothetical protein BO78DRAFT_426715 [Aspergillus sclerotiicarbonarius CBS 121057]|uniref:Zn(2)-C6 fungal-type domain-containing protein n=1 Tax=Aspergillus sclerotiicarbonarius (strain CBS 121057 / IBT 28362) TaxID=1448318 RepID=A0A319ETD1_ASPSB|nr:hypothetical protein BO78DRAFT_426715 [Aspergillus sclerotiicarbonarius CBS 121057]
MPRNLNVDPPDEQPPRKIRKGTRSCWECKHRKVRCHFVTEGDRNCRECLARGVTCHSQELPEPENSRESDRTSVSERLSRVESLLERVLQRLGPGPNDDREQHSSLAADGPPPIVDDSSTPSLDLTPSAHDNAPVLSLFDNNVLGVRRPDAPPNNTSQHGTTNSGLEKLRRNLLSLLPTQATIEKLGEANSCWWILRTQCFQEYCGSLLPIPVESLSTSHLAVIATALLWIAISLQQLPSGYDIAALELPCPPRRLMEICIASVESVIGADEMVANSTDRLECLILLGIFYNNDGKLRKSWLSYRQAMNMGQLMGLHRPISASQEKAQYLQRAQLIWKHIIYADRYLSLMLGMHHGISDAALNNTPIPNDDTAISMDRLFRIAGSIIERNQGFSSVTPAMIRATQTIDSELGCINAPIISFHDIPTTGKTRERAQCYATLMWQMWHYQLTAWLHLPLMLASGASKRYDYSFQCCLEASRHIITCYTAIRRLTEESFCCKSLDFQAFTAAVTLLISMLGIDDQQQHNSNDMLAVESVMRILEQLAKAQPDEVATRGLRVLRTLKDGTFRMAHIPSQQPVEGRTDRIKLAIPYFGAIILEREVQPQHPQSSAPAFSAVSGVQPSSSSRAGPLPESSRIEEGTFLPPGHDPSLEEQIAEIWTIDPIFAAESPFLPGFSENWDWGL